MYEASGGKTIGLCSLPFIDMLSNTVWPQVIHMRLMPRLKDSPLFLSLAPSACLSKLRLVRLWSHQLRCHANLLFSTLGRLLAPGCFSLSPSALRDNKEFQWQDQSAGSGSHTSLARSAVKTKIIRSRRCIALQPPRTRTSPHPPTPHSLAPRPLDFPLPFPSFKWAVSCGSRGFLWAWLPLLILDNMPANFRKCFACVLWFFFKVLKCRFKISMF